MWERLEPLLRELGRRAGLKDIHPGAVAGALLVCVAACAWALCHWWPQDGRTSEAPVAVTHVSSQTVASGVASEPPALCVVHVVGAVRRPGVYRLAKGSRVVDAVSAAGGLLGDADESRVNLARLVVDGEQIAIPDQDDTAAAPPGAAAAPSAVAAAGVSGEVSGGAIDLNAADATALDSLPGVGPATAAKIIADREANGPFQSVEDLARVSGIGPKKLEQLQGLVCVN